MTGNDRATTRFRHLLPGALALAAVLAPGALRADPITESIGNGPVAGATLQTFDGVALGNAPLWLPGLSVQFVDGAAVVGGSLPSVYAAPYRSNNVGQAFGATDGPDGSNFLATGVGSITLTFANPQNYFGLLWGSIDSYNNLLFFDGGSLIADYTGSQIVANANGAQDASGSAYVNFSSSQPITAVVALSTDYSFELDDIAFAAQPQSTDSASVTAVPEAPQLSIFLGGLVGLGILVYAIRSVDKNGRGDQR